MIRKKIGILGGMGPEALSDMYMEICKYYQHNFGAKYDIDFPPMIMYSVPIPDVVENIENEQRVCLDLIEAATTLQDDKCDFIVIACISVQFLLLNIRKNLHVPIIGVAETTAKYLSHLEYKKVGILSTKTTIEKKIFNQELQNIGVEIIVPDNTYQQIVTDVIMTQLAGKTTILETNRLVDVINHLRRKGAQAILLGCTDLPLVIQQKDTELPLINATHIYAQETARLSLGNI